MSNEQIIRYLLNNIHLQYSNHTNPFNTKHAKKEMRRIAVGDIMTRNVVSISPNSNLHDCTKIMAKEDLNSLIISDSKRLLGIITSRDILKLISKRSNIDLKKIKSINIASKKIAVIKPSASLSQAIAKMQACNFRRLPVLSKDKLIGVITLKDILAIAPELYSETKSIMDEIREEERKVKHVEEERPFEGLCENCGALSELLKVEGQFLCPDCREELY